MTTGTDMALPPIPETLRARMAQLGPRWGENVSVHVREMVQAFTPVLAQSPRVGLMIERNIHYGAHPRQVLDVHRVAGASRCPVVIFVHGGAFVDGDKDRTPEVYSNVTRYLARGGIIGVNMEYRLAPEFKYPCASEDVGAALAWVRAHSAEFGGDPDRIFLMGHSAGAAHTGAFAYDARLHGTAGPGVAGHIVVSGRVRAEMRTANPNATKVAAYYGTDEGFLDACSPVAHVSATSVPTMIAVAEFENPLIDVHCLELAYRIAQAKGRAPQVLWLEGHNHTSIIASMDTADERLGAQIVRFVRSAAPTSQPLSSPR